MKKRVLLVLASLSLLILPACGGGGGGSDIGSSGNITSAGYWSGNIIDDTGSSYPVLGLVSPDGELRFLVYDSGSVTTELSGRVDISGDRASGNVTAYSVNGTSLGGPMVVSGTISYTVAEKQYIAGAYSIPGQTGNFNLNYEIGAEMEVAQVDLKGNWGYNIPGSQVNISIDENGNFNGIDDLGCRYNGTAKVIDSSWNIYRLNFAVSQCGGYNGNYSGLSTIETENNQDYMLAMVSSPTLAIADIFLYSSSPWL